MNHHKWMATLCVVLAIPALLAAQEKKGGLDLKGAVVRVEVVNQEANYMDPWNMRTQGSSSGSGCVIAGERILTNAHVVSDQMYISVQKAGDVEKYTARVEFVAHDCDLALLKVGDSAFFQGVSPIALGGIPAEGERVTAYGFPAGGSKISVTQGVVSRIELKSYSHSKLIMLAIQIDAALNPGNSGGPVIQDGRLVGIAFQVLENSENNGDMIPVPVIERFLADIRDGRYDGVPVLSIDSQSMENPAMRSFLKMGEKQTGVYICNVHYGSTADAVFRAGDVLLKLDGVPVANDSTVPFGSERIGYRHLTTKYQVGDEIPVTLLRDGEVLERKARMDIFRPLVMRPQYDERPEFLVFAGLVFMPETHDYLQTWGKSTPPPDLLSFYRYGRKRGDLSEVVLLTKVLANDINRGYQDMLDEIVTRVNDHAIGHMGDLVSALARPRGGYHVIELQYGDRIILDAKAAEKAHPEILRTYNIPTDRSDDLKDNRR